jgi:hypothetical protein
MIPRISSRCFSTPTQIVVLRAYAKSFGLLYHVKISQNSTIYTLCSVAKHMNESVNMNVCKKKQNHN